ncbi:MAG TPA: hypothetical protein VFG07_04640 [Thermoplasmata archaeon]|nr:hypothetical protein [Thermoplasmata archaeon]
MAFLGLCLLLVGVLLIPYSATSATGGAHLLTGRSLATAAVTTAAVSPAQLSLTTSAQPSVICALGVAFCTAGVDEARVLLTATTPNPIMTWPDVQVAFVIETTAFDGVYDPNDPVQYEKQQGTGYDPCATHGNGLCEESNGVPFFVANAQGIAASIQSANPHSTVTFAMADYAGTGDTYDDYSDQINYHVDSSQFLPASQFGSMVQTQFQGGVLGGGYILHDEDLADNFLHSSSISAFYGVIQGSGFQWVNNTHHVIVWMGSTSPRDPSYPQNYCVSPSGMILDDYPLCHGTTCEPSQPFPTGVSPNCEGWVHSQDGNPAHSIAALAHTSPNCVDAVGKVCTIDMIDLWDTPTDPYSSGWPTGQNLYGGTYPGPGSVQVIEDSTNVLISGCDLAAATGGTWTGPRFFTCPDGQSGTLSYVAHGPPAAPNTNNPSLMAAFRSIGFGPVMNNEVAVGVGQPLFSFVPYGNIAISSTPEFATSCKTPTGFSLDCPVTPSVSRVGNVPTYGWNWSVVPANNVLFVGDTWSAAFNVVDTGPPYSTVPVDACATQTCYSRGSGSEFGAYTWASYLLPNSTQRVTQSFPLAQVTVSIAGLPVGTTPPPFAPPPPPAIPVLAPIQINLPQPLAVPVQSPLGSLSVQATAAGLLMAGMTRLMMKNKPIAMQMAMKNGPAQSQFEKGTQTGPEMGRFE